jgi:hypothetical protein
VEVARSCLSSHGGKVAKSGRLTFAVVCVVTLGTACRFGYQLDLEGGSDGMSPQRSVTTGATAAGSAAGQASLDAGMGGDPQEIVGGGGSGGLATQGGDTAIGGNGGDENGGSASAGASNGGMTSGGMSGGTASGGSASGGTASGGTGSGGTSSGGAGAGGSAGTGGTSSGGAGTGGSTGGGGSSSGSGGSGGGPVDACGGCSLGYACIAGTCQPAKRVFITEATYQPDFGSASAATQICQTTANTRSFGGAWLAWIVDNKFSPATDFNQSSVPYVLLDGTIVANNWADLVDGTLAHPIDMNELGGNVGAREAWTGATEQGIASGDNCNNWKSNQVAILGTNGVSSVTDYGWSDIWLQYCDRWVSLYCFEQ